jgi:hypothetical protein
MLNLNTASTGVENTDTAITGFASDGFTMDGSNHPNVSPYTYVGWGWNAGGSNQTISVGQYATSPANVPSIASTVRANTTAGFSVVSFTTTSATGTATVGHGLGATPSMIIMKNRDRTFNWEIYHISATASSGRLIFTTSAKLTDANPWNQNNQAPTTTIFGYDQAWNGFSGDKIIAYCFAPVAGYSAFGSYTGNGSGSGSGTGDGPFVYTGFRPRWIMVKVISGTTANWSIIDTARSPYNFADKELWPSSNAAEQTYAVADILSNGFKLRSDSGQWNTNGAVYIYAAFAESPFKYSLAR